MIKIKLFFLILTLFITSNISKAQTHSIAREWNEMLLETIRNDFARPTVHARNLFHSSIAMYDIWSIYTGNGKPYLIGNTVNGYTSNFNGLPPTNNLNASIEEAISYAMYRLLLHRFQTSPAIVTMFSQYNSFMNNKGYITSLNGTNYASGSAAEFGNFVAQQIINYGLIDNSNEQIGYGNINYTPVNPNLVIDLPGNSSLVDFNRWQPLSLDIFIDQSGNVIPINTPDFLSPEWGNVFNFSLSNNDLTIYNRNNFDYHVYHDPGMPPLIDTVSTNITEYKWNFALVTSWSSHLDPNDGVMWDISPASIGNINLNDYPTNFSEYLNFYNSISGGDASNGHTLNPTTNLPYQPQIVPRGDYARVLAEFWADGPDSETPPGHWYTILNYVNDNPIFEKKYEGTTILDSLEWDVKAYFTLGGAMHDAAITAWGNKGWYDYIRPVSAIRGMCELGQSSNPSLPNYNPKGYILFPGLIELVDSNDILVGANNENLNKVKVKAWKGPNFINNTATDIAGVDWILAENWWPYQRPSFVTPPFAGYVSGHSTFSRAAAEIMTAITGDEFFPGGLGEFIAPKDNFLVFENGPSIDVTLQWATYRDASDQCSLSRIWGGIHPPVDDIPGRLMGEKIGKRAHLVAKSYFENEYCINSIFKTGNIVANNLTKAAIDVTSDANIVNTTNVTYEAGSFVELLIDFEVDANSNFTAQIDDCN